MTVLTRYLIRAQIGPFLFALIAMTALVFLNAVARQIDSLVGRGLPWTVIAEFLVLSLPHTVALSLPIAVLAAVLYCFSDMTSNNEITALSANGVSPARVLAPVLVLGAVATVVMLGFHDRVLPEANHRLKNLTFNIGRKSPTLELKEQVVNRIQTEITGTGRGAVFFLTADRIDPETNELESVGILDANNPSRKRVTWAERGEMAFNAAETDLYLTLEDGVVNEMLADRLGGFRRIYFDREVIPLRNVGTMFEEQYGSSRSDREMGFGLLRESADEKKAELDSIQAENRETSLRAVRLALARGTPTDILVRDRELERGTRGLASRLGDPSSLLADDAFASTTILGTRQRAVTGRMLSQSQARYELEIHKKSALAVACIIFTLIGPPLAIRFPSGGIGMVVAMAGGIASIYWAGLIGGENLADGGAADPAITMWAANVIFLGVGLWLAITMGGTRIALRSSWFEELGSRLFPGSRSRPGISGQPAPPAGQPAPPAHAGPERSPTSKPEG